MQQNKNRTLAIGFMLFALFFGAGNLIFPAAMGQNAGTDVWYAVAGFLITGVGLPLFGVAAIAYSGCEGLHDAASRVHPLYGLFYTVVAYLSIGPCFAIPRTGTVAFEIAVRPFLGSLDGPAALPIFLAVFFLISWWFAASPSKLVDRIGKVLTPALLFVLLLLIAKSILTPMGVPAAPAAAYSAPLTAAVQGLLDGYNTLDAIAAFVFATLVVEAVRESGCTQRAELTREVYKAGTIAAVCLGFVYIFIAKLGAESVPMIGLQDTGAPVLAESAKILFGHIGAVILAVIVLLACLSTAIGLITCCAGYALRLCSKFSYKAWTVIFTVVSYLIGLFGLKTIIVSTIPVLMFIYPLIVALGCLLFLNNLFGGRQCVYAWTIGATFIMATINLLETAKISLGGLEAILRDYVPLHTLGLGWIPFAVVGFVIGLVWKRLVPEKKTA